VTTTRSGTTPPGPDDGELLARLGSLRERTAPPPDVAERARQAFAFRSLDAEVAALVFDSEAAVGSGSEPLLAVRRSSSRGERRLVFESADERLYLELTVTSSAGRRRLEGQVLPTGSVAVELRRGSAPGPVPVDADPLGGFVVEGLEPGPIRVICRRPDELPVSSEWLLLD
jgi:hypothetical protein